MPEQNKLSNSTPQARDKESEEQKRSEESEIYKLPTPLRDDNRQQPFQIKVYTEKEEGAGLNRQLEEASSDYQEDKKDEKRENRTVKRLIKNS